MLKLSILTSKISFRFKHVYSRPLSQTILSFKNVNFEYGPNKPMLTDATFTIKQGMKYTIMGQNGSGKSTIVKLMNGNLQPTSGQINLQLGAAVSTAMQVMPRDCKDLTLYEFFKKILHGNSSGIDSLISNALLKVKLDAPRDRVISTFSGGQQARLLLAAAFILSPDVMLLDEPTNNLDVEGVQHLQQLIMESDKACVVISHDEHFLNSFTDSVLYLDSFSKKVEQYDGDYNTVKDEISRRIQRESSENARLKRTAQAKMEQANSFANKVSY